MKRRKNPSRTRFDKLDTGAAHDYTSAQFWRTVAAQFAKPKAAEMTDAQRKELRKFLDVAKAMVKQKPNPRRKPRRNPQVLTINPSAANSLERAREAYRTFHGCDPEKVRRIGKGKGVLIALGELLRIDYKPRRGDRKGTAWFHHFRKGAVLAGTPDGKRLFIIDREGKRAVDWARGIVR